jgi:RNA polymerase sigma factor (sigma-70 family)
VRLHPGLGTRRRPGSALVNAMSATSTGWAGWADADLVNLYLAEIGRYPLLSPAEELRLGALIERGRQARDELDRDIDLTELRTRQLKKVVAEADEASATFVTSNLRLVVSIARRYERRGLPLLDLIQEGNIGLMRAVARFDHRRGFRFSTYAAWPIRQAITRGIADKARLVRLPVHTGELVARVRDAQTVLEAEHGRRPTVDELARLLGVPPHRVTEALLVAEEAVSLLAPPVSGGSEKISATEDMHAVSPLEHAVVSMELETMSCALAALDEVEYEVLRLRFGLGDDEPASLAEAARRLELSVATARTVLQRAMKKVRRSMRELERTR